MLQMLKCKQVLCKQEADKNVSVTVVFKTTFPRWVNKKRHQVDAPSTSKELALGYLFPGSM